MIKDLTSKEKELAEYMSSLSEKAYCAGWVEGLEYALWTALEEDRPMEYGFIVITPKDISRLRELSISIGGWIYYDNQRGEKFIPLNLWKKMYSNRVSS